MKWEHMRKGRCTEVFRLEKRELGSQGIRNQEGEYVEVVTRPYERVINLCVQRSKSGSNWEAVAKRILVLCQGSYWSELAKGERGIGEPCQGRDLDVGLSPRKRKFLMF